MFYLKLTDYMILKNALIFLITYNQILIKANMNKKGSNLQQNLEQTQKKVKEFTFALKIIQNFSYKNGKTVKNVSIEKKRLYKYKNILIIPYYIM